MPALPSVWTDAVAAWITLGGLTRPCRAHAPASIIERLWRSLKYEAIYLHELADGFEAERVIAEWIAYYNAERPHSSLDGAAPAEFYAANRPVDMMDKAGALPTSPRAQQQQKAFGLERILAA
jgi:hypothetical protein